MLSVATLLILCLVVSLPDYCKIMIIPIDFNLNLIFYFDHLYKFQCPNKYVYVYLIYLLECFLSCFKGKPA